MVYSVTRPLPRKRQMAQTLTARTIETIKPGAERREIADRHMPGLCLVLQPSGAKSWAVRYRHAGTPRKHTLGSYPVIDLKSARGLASKALRAVAEGRDPGREKMQERTAKPDTVEAVARQFVERHCKRSNRPRTARETQRLLDLHVLPRWRGRLVRDIIRRDVLDLLDRVVDGGKPIAANRTLAAIRKMFNWAVARDIIAASPCAGVKPPTAERSRFSPVPLSLAPVRGRGNTPLQSTDGPSLRQSNRGSPVAHWSIAGVQAPTPEAPIISVMKSRRFKLIELHSGMAIEKA